MSISTRLREYCDSKNIRQTDLIKNNIAVKGTVDKVWHNKQEPSANFLANFFTYYKDAKVRYIITGDENNILEEPKTEYGLCRECFKKDVIIEFLKKECAAKDRRIEELLKYQPPHNSENLQGKKAS